MRTHQQARPTVAEMMERDLFNRQHYRGRVNCPHCGRYFCRVLGQDEAEHLSHCPKCNQFFVWFVLDARVISIGREKNLWVPLSHALDQPATG